MGYYRVTGGGTIGGEYTVRGSKNAVLPILAASILSGDEVVLENVPHITDVFVSLEILEELGCKTKLEGRTLTIDSRNIEKTEISEEMVGKMRSSILYLGGIVGTNEKSLSGTSRRMYYRTASH